MAPLEKHDHDQADIQLRDAWDFKGRPALRSSTGGWTSAAMIIGVEACERLTTLGIAVNLVMYLTLYASGECYLRQHCHEFPRHLFHAPFAWGLRRRHFPRQVSNHCYICCRSSNCKHFSHGHLLVVLI